MIPGPLSLRAVVLAPTGRDGAVAQQILGEAGLHTHACETVAQLVEQLELGAGLALIAEEALRDSHLDDLVHWAQTQPSWSDFPFIVLTYRILAGQSPIADVLTEKLGNVSFVERPFHPTSLISLVRSAVRGRRRQYDARAGVEALRQGQEQLRFAQEAGRIGAFELFPATGMLSVTPTFCSLWGLPLQAEVPLASLVSLLDPDDRRLIKTQGSSLDPDALDYVEYRIRRMDTGEMRWIARQGEEIHDAETGGARYFGVAYDITDRKRSETLLRQFNEMLEVRVQERTRERDRAWKNSRDLQVVVAPSGVFTAANQAWTAILDWPIGDVIGKQFDHFIHPEDLSASTEALGRALTADLPAFENRLRHRDGDYRWFSWVAAPEEGLIYASGRHITAEKRAAEDLERAQDALRQSQKMEAVGQLTGGIAHDFNNLLGAMTGSMEMIQTRLAQGRAADVERYLQAAQSAGRRASALTHRLLAFSRRQTLDPRPTDLNRLVSGMADLIRRTMGPSVHMEVIESGGLWSTLIDAHQMENALLNLCINARDAMPDGGRLTIETTNRAFDEPSAKARDLTPGQYISLCVADTGTGMTPEVAARAFDPFFTTKPMGEGTGLGLSMIYGFVRQSGGQVRVSSQVGKGTTMCLYLPRHFGPADGVGPEPVVGAEAPGEGETILIVDDEPTIRMLVAEALTDAGYTVIEAGDGPAGLRILQSGRHVDLLITDVGLPGGVNGRQLADAARVARTDLKVLFITGYAENAVVGNTRLEAGMEVLTKPFVITDLSSRVRTVLGR